VSNEELVHDIVKEAFEEQMAKVKDNKRSEFDLVKLLEEKRERRGSCY